MADTILSTPVDYGEFLRAKIKMAKFSGFTLQAGQIHEALYPHQREVVRWAVQGGNRAILKGRRGGGSELNPAYFTDQVHYLKAAEREHSMPDLFDVLEVA